MKSICKTCKVEYEHEDPSQNVCWDCAEKYLDGLRAEWENQMLSQQDRESMEDQDD